MEARAKDAGPSLPRRPCPYLLLSITFPNSKGYEMKKVFTGCLIAFGIFVAFIMVLLVGLGVAITEGYLPDAVALPKGKIHPRYIETMRTMGVLEADEEAQYFYSAAMTSIKNNGNLFTDKRVITYSTYNDKLDISAATYAEITGRARIFL